MKTDPIGPVRPILVESRSGAPRCRIGLSVSGSFDLRCLTSLSIRTFPDPALQTGRAVFRHPAFVRFGQFSPTGG